MTELEEKDLQKKVLDSKKPTVLYFSAPWCGPCKTASKKMEEISKNNSESFNTYKVNIDAEQGLATRYGIDCIPTYVVIKNGKVVEKFSGLDSIEDRILKAAKD
jgi:thioredoxin 1